MNTTSVLKMQRELVAVTEERDRLAAELAKMRAAPAAPQALDIVGIAVDGVSRETLVAIAKALSTEVRRLREENAQLRKDAERYRWLSDDGGIHSLPYDDFGCGPVFDLSREAIDAAWGAK